MANAKFKGISQNILLLVQHVLPLLHIVKFVNFIKLIVCFPKLLFINLIYKHNENERLQELKKCSKQSNLTQMINEFYQLRIIQKLQLDSQMIQLLTRLYLFPDQTLNYRHSCLLRTEGFKQILYKSCLKFGSYLILNLSRFK